VAPTDDKAPVPEIESTHSGDVAPRPASHTERSEAESSRNAGDADAEAGLSNPVTPEQPEPVVVAGIADPGSENA
jgi:hypothetical protein